MSKVKMMSIDLANKIAAGEVVDRPSSVIKELVENSIDANSSNIEVTIKDGGRTFIKVVDDGVGMDKEDSLLCFQRHASSKIKTVLDLNNIRTLGFRGEAIPSIASVSKVTLETSNGEDGTKVTNNPDGSLTSESSSLRKGTIFTVENLFYNVPARLKFLKSDKFERMKCVEVMEHLAFAFPNIKFTVYSDGKLVFKTSGRNDLKETILSVRGLEIAKSLLPIEYSDNGIDVSGYIAKPEINFSTRFEINIYLNNRYVYVYKINKAIEKAYKDYLSPNRYPLVYLNINIDPFLVDVNVHPTKKEVRISNEDEIVATIKKLVAEKLKQIKPTYNSNNSFYNFFSKDEKEEKPVEQMSLPLEENKENNFAYSEVNKELNSSIFTEVEKKAESTIINNNFNSVQRVVNDSKAIQTNTNIEVNKTKSKEVEALFSDLTILGQIADTFIVFNAPEGMLIMDQHAAAERINFEKYSKLFENNVERSYPLIPIIIDVNPSLKINLDQAHINVFNKYGFEVDDFGSNQIKVSTVPSFLVDNESAVRDIIYEVLRTKEVNINDIIHLKIATIACKASIKANKHLSYVEIESLVKQLRECDNPANCPHGRPTVILVTKYELEKLFKRTGF